MGSQNGTGDTRRTAYLQIVSGKRQGFFGDLSRGLLRAFSAGYRVASWLDGRRQRMTATRLPCKVISVGNITVGGTGKTPMVEWIARRLKEAGHNVGIVSRGYGAGQDCGLNDEGQMLAENLDAVPHLQDKNRLAACKALIKNHNPDVIVLDDGFQHRRLMRDLDIVMIDATAPFGYGHLLPRGLLRESPRALRRADMVVLSRCDQVPPEAVDDLADRILRFAPQVTVARSTHAPVSLLRMSDREEMRLDWFGWNRVAAFCGIANPDAFRSTLNNLGCEPTLFEVYPDHNLYSREQVEAIVSRAARSGADAVVTTQKDAVKLADCADLKLPVLELKVELRLQIGSEILTEWLETLLTHSAREVGEAPAPARRKPDGR